MTHHSKMMKVLQDIPKFDVIASYPLQNFLKSTLLLAFLLADASWAVAGLPITEHFVDSTACTGGTSYAVGSVAVWQTNCPANGPAAWTVAGPAGTTNTIASANFNISGLAESSGGSMEYGVSTGPSARLNLGASVTSGTLYYSFALKVTDLGSLSASGAFVVAFNNSSGNQSGTPSVIAACLMMRSIAGDPGGFNIGVRKVASGTPTWSPTAFHVNDVIFVVGSYTFNTGSGTDDQAKMWLNPNPSTFGGATPADELVHSDAATDFAAIASLLFFRRSTPTLQPADMFSDEIRVGRTWADVTPRFPSTPSSRTNNAGSTAVFSTTPIANTAGLVYQWKKNGADITDGVLSSGAIASGATTATLTLTGVLKGDEGAYTVAATNSVNQGISLGATLTVNDPVITTQPTASQTVTPGTTVNLSVVAAGTPTVSYRWQKGGVDLSNGGVVSGATTTNLTLTGVSTTDSGTYTCAVTNGSGAGVISSIAVVTVVDPAILTSPASLTNNYGTSASFTVSAVGTPPFTYCWLKNGVSLANGGNVSGATTDTLTLNPVSYLDVASYSVIVTNGIGATTTSASASLTVNDPYIVTQPSSRTNTDGTPATFTVSANGSPTLTYEWRKGATALVNGGDISGADTATLTLANVASATAGSYSVIVSNAGGLSATSSAAVLTVASPPAITQGPASRSVAAGAKVGFGVVASGYAPLSYQWKSNNVEIPGATASSYIITSAQAAAAANYTVVVTNVAGTASASATLSIISGNVYLYETNLVVLRQGDGGATLTDRGNSVYLDQYTTSGTYLSTVGIPDDGSSALVQAATYSTDSGVGGTAVVDYLSRSPDGWFVALMGYATNLNYGAQLSASASTVVPRGGGTVNGLGGFVRNVTTTTKFSSTTTRGFVTDGQNNFWGGAGNGGTVYLGLGSPSANVQTVSAATRAMNIYNGNIYFGLGNADPKSGLYRITGLPTGTAPADLIIERATTDASIGNPPAGSLNGIQDFAISSDGSVIYIADDRSITNGLTGGIEKWTDSGGYYVFSYRLNTDLAKGLRSLAVDWSGANPVLYATTVSASSTNALVKVADTGASAPFTTVAVSAPNHLFRGVKFGPKTPAMTLAISSSSPGVYTLDFSGVPNASCVLQRSCNDLASWLDVATNTAAANTGAAQFTDTPGCAPAYYRVRQE